MQDPAIVSFARIDDIQNVTVIKRKGASVAWLPTTHWIEDRTIKLKAIFDNGRNARGAIGDVGVQAEELFGHLALPVIRQPRSDGRRLGLGLPLVLRHDGGHLVLCV